eukprot:s4856_g3.t1
MVLLAKPPEKKLHSIDAKLAQALGKVIDRAGEKAAGVRSELRMKNDGQKGGFIKGRGLFAMILANFKSLDHILKYCTILPICNQLEAFYMKWLDAVYNMKADDDRPSKNSLRDHLFRKFENSKLMTYDIHKYKALREGDPDRTYEYLLEMIKGYIQRGKQDKLLAERERAAKLSFQNSRSTPAEFDEVTNKACSSEHEAQEGEYCSSILNY